MALRAPVGWRLLPATFRQERVPDGADEIKSVLAHFKADGTVHLGINYERRARHTLSVLFVVPFPTGAMAIPPPLKAPFSHP